MTTRKSPNMTEKLAAAYLSLIEFKDGKWQPVIDRIAAKKMTAWEICSLFEIDHYPISVYMGGDNHPTNLTPMLKADHREKTNKVDAKTHAKLRRNAKKKSNRPTLTAEDVAEVAEMLEAYAVPGAITMVEGKDFQDQLDDNCVKSCGCVFKDLCVPCTNDDCTICVKRKTKENLTARQKAYRKAVYAQRAAKRKKPHGWSKKKL